MTITTRRAIEVCLSRLRLSDAARDDLAYQLNATIRNGEPPAPEDADGLLAVIAAAEYDLSGIDITFPKKAIIGRIVDAKLRLRRARAALTDEAPHG